MSNVWLIRSTYAGKDEAISIANTLLKDKLIACANIEEKVTSLYHWEGSIQQENEIVAWFKTTAPHVPSVIERIKSLHSYQLPSITAWPSLVTEPAFANWVATEVS